MLGHCRLTNIPAEYSICDLFAKLAAYSRNLPYIIQLAILGEHSYYVVENTKSTDHQALKVGHIIMKLPIHASNLFVHGDGPYKSLPDLKKYSPIYQALKKSNLKRAQQIVKDKNIVKPVKFILTPKDTKFDKEIVDGFLHAAFGKVKNGTLTGVHFYDPEKIKIIEILEVSSITKVFKAEFEYFDFKSNKWIKKKGASTFFPKNWILSTLLMECKFAFDKINNGNLDDGKYKSFTKSNIPVSIIIKNGKIKSLYPLL